MTQTEQAEAVKSGGFLSDIFGGILSPKHVVRLAFHYLAQIAKPVLVGIFTDLYTRASAEEKTRLQTDLGATKDGLAAGDYQAAATATVDVLTSLRP